ncbi:nucleotidyltransferase family protein [Shewanella surugensis]|uniref:Nucleotidyltransferase family protein n=1 Tax=Shewanella surugensis TaxID=212020 RepID=A0ABT0LI16_9GAMM|nr:nucleotidyltransferase family protein [Shewanella surugensis]MCL1127331.1 nucleotidyltransferase family protein [Shewanella surugensis]
MDRIITWIKQDLMRLKALECAASLNLPDGYIAAGFVRNLVWDHLHKKSISTPLNDIDVIYFDDAALNSDNDKVMEAELVRLMPEVNWQVRNQALIHIRNGDRPYLNIRDAMRFWPEKETAVAIRQLESDTYECIAAFGFESLFQLLVTHNPNRSRDIFDERVSSKRWLTHWPQLTVYCPSSS